MEKCHDTFEQAFEQFAIKYIKIVTYDYLIYSQDSDLSCYTHVRICSFVHVTTLM